MPIPREDVGDLFPPYPSSPAAIGEAADAMARPSAALDLTRDDVLRAQGVAVSAVEGQLTAPVAVVADPASTGLAQVRDASRFGAAAVRRWSGHVTTYDTGVRGLNDRWRSGVVTNFGQGFAGPATTGDAEADAAAATTARQDVADARGALHSQLQREYVGLGDTLDGDAGEVASLIRSGPSAETFTDLFTSGDLSAPDYLGGAEIPTGVEATLARLIADGTLPAEAASMDATELSDYLLDHPDVAQDLVDGGGSFATPGSVEDRLIRILTQQVASPAGTTGVEAQRDLDVRALFAGLDPADAALLATLLPGLGNAGGVPFVNRAQANRTAVVAALAAEREELDGLRDDDADHEGDNGWLGWKSWNDDDLDGDISDAEDTIALYESILDGDRQIILFDPSGDGAIAELHGTIDGDTDNVGVIVPGTTTDMSSIDGTMGNAQSFVDNDPDGSLAMITWMGGDLPDSVAWDAPAQSYTDDLGPLLADFSGQLGDEMDALAAPGAQTTFAGHSYGGAVVGIAETYGLETDRVLHVESAGVGHDVDSIDDYALTQAEIDRYSMTAPSDPIGLSQGVEVGGVGHGADPDTFADTTQLDTGDYADGEEVRGGDAHSGVFDEGSDSWQNMYEVFTGGEVSIHLPDDVLMTQGGPAFIPYDGPPIYQDIE